MKKAELTQLVKEIIDEVTVTGTGASFNPGQGEQTATPYLLKKKSGDNRAVKFLKKTGYTKVDRPKRPSHTKLFDYLDEELN
jgi:hypothetical protein